MCICGHSNCSITHGTCHCGCGENTTIAHQSRTLKRWKIGEPKLYVAGHRAFRNEFAKKGPNSIEKELIEGIPCIWILTSRGEWTVIWESHYDIVKGLRWWCSANGYAYTTLPDGHNIQMARVILFDLGDREADHENGDRLDNRGSNIRPASNLENHWNLKVSKRNLSGASGVSPARNGKWRSRISVNGVQIALGEFTEKEKAIEVRLAAEVKYYGEFRRNKTCLSC